MAAAAADIADGNGSGVSDTIIQRANYHLVRYSDAARNIDIGWNLVLHG
jgi:hypothetical protein